MRASCSAELIAPMSVFLSSGSPRRSVAMRVLQRGDDLLGDRLLHEQARAGAADVALVEEDAVDDALDGLVERRVVEDDVGGLAAELEAQALGRAGDAALDQLADLGRARERDLVDAVVLDERLPDRGAAGDDVDDAGRQVALGDDLGERERRQRRRLGGLEHDGVARRERRRDLPGRHQQREVPGDDLRRRRRSGAATGRSPRARACRPSRRSRRSARRRAGCRRRATRGSACRCRATRARRARGRAPGSRARCGRGTSRARARAGRARPSRRRARAARDGGVDVGRARPRPRRPAACAVEGSIVATVSPAPGAELAVHEDAVGRAQARGLARLGRRGVLEGRRGGHAQSTVT